MKPYVLALALAAALFLAPRSLGADDFLITDIAAGSTDVQAKAAEDRLRFCGFSLRETTGSAPAVIKIYRGTSTAGALLFTISVAASESRSEGPWTSCLPSAAGVFITRSGSAEIAIYTKVGYAPY